MKNVILAIALIALTFQCSTVCANNQHGNKPLPVSNPQHSRRKQLRTHTAGVVEYTTSGGTGLSAVFLRRVYIDGYPHHGYQLTDNASGAVGWNIPSTGQPPLSIAGFIYTTFDIASNTNFGSNPPFSVVAKTSDGVTHVCSGGQGGYSFVPNGPDGRYSFSTYQATASDFAPAITSGETVTSLAYIYQGGDQTISFADPFVSGAEVVLGPGSYTYSMKNDTTFNYQN